MAISPFMSVGTGSFNQANENMEFEAKKQAQTDQILTENYARANVEAAKTLAATSAAVSTGHSQNAALANSFGYGDDPDAQSIAFTAGWDKGAYNPDKAKAALLDYKAGRYKPVDGSGPVNYSSAPDPKVAAAFGNMFPKRIQDNYDRGNKQPLGTSANTFAAAYTPPTMPGLSKQYSFTPGPTPEEKQMLMSQIKPDTFKGNQGLYSQVLDAALHDKWDFVAKNIPTTADTYADVSKNAADSNRYTPDAWQQAQPYVQKIIAGTATPQDISAATALQTNTPMINAQNADGRTLKAKKDFLMQSINPDTGKTYTEEEAKRVAVLGEQNIPTGTGDVVHFGASGAGQRVNVTNGQNTTVADTDIRDRVRQAREAYNSSSAALTSIKTTPAAVGTLGSIAGLSGLIIDPLRPIAPDLAARIDKVLSPEASSAVQAQLANAQLAFQNYTKDGRGGSGHSPYEERLMEVAQRGLGNGKILNGANVITATSSIAATQKLIAMRAASDVNTLNGMKAPNMIYDDKAQRNQAYNNRVGQLMDELSMSKDMAQQIADADFSRQVEISRLRKAQ